MVNDLIKEAERWDLEPKQASLWWTNMHADEIMDDMEIKTTTGATQAAFSRRSSRFRETFLKEPDAKDHLEERMQSANTAWWREMKINRSKDVPWSVKCKRMAEQLYSVFCFGRSWSVAIPAKIIDWEAKAVKRLFRFNRKEEETLAGYCTTTARAARTTWKKHEASFLV